MNPFVNPKKRSVQLPKGCKDLVDVLQGSDQPKCEYCHEPAIVTLGWRDDYRWCGECQQDLKDFAARQDFKFDFNTNDDAAVSRFRAEYQRRMDDFMRQRVNERKSK